MIISANHLELTYNDQRSIIEDGNFVINEKDFVFISGASGSGKSTLLKSLYANILPKSGELIVDGYNINKLSSTSSLKKINKQSLFVKIKKILLTTNKDYQDKYFIKIKNIFKIFKKKKL